VLFGAGRPGEPPARVGLIDVGTNTVLCTVLFREGPRTLVVAEDLHFITGLGRGRGRDGSLSEAGMARAWRALRHVCRRLDELGVAASAVRGAATAACREAPNGPAFLAGVRDELGLPLEIVAGEREADLAGLAQAKGFPGDEPLVVMDIGGGSTEIALVRADQGWRVSIPWGATKLGEAVGPDGGIADAERVVATALDGVELGGVPAGARLIGVAGTVTTGLQVQDGTDLWDPTRLHGRVVGVEEARELGRRLLAMGARARREVSGLHPMRADFLGPGLLWQAALMERLGFEELTSSDRGVRFGLLWDAWPRAVVR